MGSLRFLLPAVLALGGGGDQTGTLVVRLVSDPAPAGVAWSYSGAGASFQLGENSTTRTLSLAAGTYDLTESPASGQASALTALACSDPTRDTTADLKAASARVNVGDGE